MGKTKWERVNTNVSLPFFFLFLSLSGQRVLVTQIHFRLRETDSWAERVSNTNMQFLGRESYFVSKHKFKFREEMKEIVIDRERNSKAIKNQFKLMRMLQWLL